jgi:hypothetical protein
VAAEATGAKAKEAAMDQAMVIAATAIVKARFNAFCITKLNFLVMKNIPIPHTAPKGTTFGVQAHRFQSVGRWSLL